MNVFARLCLVLGGLFAVDAVVFWSLQHEHIGTSLIAMTAVGFAFLGARIGFSHRGGDTSSGGAWSAGRSFTTCAV